MARKADESKKMSKVAQQIPQTPAASAQTGAHLDAPSAALHPNAGMSSGAVKSDSKVQS